MELLWNGIKYGFALSLLVGPILFTLVTTSIEQGFRAGWMVGLGLWASDLLFAVVTYFGVSFLAAQLQSEGFRQGMNVGGCIFFMIFGIAALLIKTPGIERFEHEKVTRRSSYLALWFRGFFINSINPFTVIFWLTFPATVLFRDTVLLPPPQAGIFYAGLLGMLVLTDTLKVALAKFIRRWMTPVIIFWMQRVAGVAFIIAGFVLLGRAYGN